MDQEICNQVLGLMLGNFWKCDFHILNKSINLCHCLNSKVWKPPLGDKYLSLFNPSILQLKIKTKRYQCQHPRCLGKLLCCPRHPITLSEDDWGVQSLPQPCIYVPCSHSQKVIGSLGIIMDISYHYIKTLLLLGWWIYPQWKQWEFRPHQTWWDVVCILVWPQAWHFLRQLWGTFFGKSWSELK